MLTFYYSGAGALVGGLLGLALSAFTRYRKHRGGADTAG